MEHTDVRERPSSGNGANVAPFDLVPSKLLPPLVQPGTIRRPLLDRLTRGDPHRIISVAAPPGYGKTTLLAQWAKSTAPGAVQTPLTGGASWDFPVKRVISYQSHDAGAGQWELGRE